MLKRSLVNLAISLPITCMIVAGCKLPGGNSDSSAAGTVATSSSSSSGSGESGSSSSGGGGPTLAEELVGTWVSPCASTSSIGGVNTWIQYQIIFNSSLTYWYDINYFSDSGCTQNTITVGSVGGAAIGQRTSTPAGGYAITYTITGSDTLSMNGTYGSYLNDACADEWSTTGESHYDSPEDGMTCTDDSRFSEPGEGAQALNVIVMGSGSFQTGAVSDNLPGGGTVPSSTSLTFSQL